VGGATRDTGIRKVGAPISEIDPVDVEPEAICRDLIQCGPGPLTHLVRTNLHDAAAVLAQHRLGMTLEHERRKRRRADAPADEQSIMIAHLPRL